jgi:hypothetical protein
VINDSLQIATMMSATGSFDHRAIDGADGARLMQAFKRLVENPLGCWPEMPWLTLTTSSSSAPGPAAMSPRSARRSSA